MKEELTNVLQYSKYSYEGHGTGNSCNGYYTRNYDTKYGMIENHKISCDRNNEFEQLKKLNSGISVLKLRRDIVSSDAVYFILGVDEEGYREVLGFYFGLNESAYVWEDNHRQIKERGLNEVLLFVMDGLTGLDDAVHKYIQKRIFNDVLSIKFVMQFVVFVRKISTTLQLI